MSDIHRLPLLGHDLPAIPTRGRVYKRGELDWVWVHFCASAIRPFWSGGLHPSQESALAFLLAHMKGCR